MTDRTAGVSGGKMEARVNVLSCPEDLERSIFIELWGSAALIDDLFAHVGCSLQFRRHLTYQYSIFFGL